MQESGNNGWKDSWIKELLKNEKNKVGIKSAYSSCTSVTNIISLNQILEVLLLYI